MKINLAAYGYENFKPNLDNVTTKDLLTKSPFDAPDSLVGYVLPKEFAARLSSKLGFDEIIFPYRDVPLTNRNILESHIFTKCALLEAPTEKYNYLLPVFNSIQVWGETSEQPTSFSKFSFYIQKEYLDLFQDRIRFIPPQLDEDDSIDPIVLLKACGVSYADLFKNIIEFINTTVDFKYQRNIVNFLKTYICVRTSVRGIFFKSKIRGVSNFGPHTTDPYQIARFLYTIYFSQYTQWTNDSSWAVVKGDRIYVDHHSVYEIGKFDEYLTSNVHYRNRLPFGIHPSKYFKERIEKLAAKTHSEARSVTYPKDFKGYIDLSNSPHRQLLTGLDLVNEGVFMKHCVGGDNYQESMADGDMLFFHLHIPGDKYGATLSMSSAGQYRGAYRLNGQWWGVDQYYGFDDSYAHGGAAKEVLEGFLKTHFTPYSSKLVKKIYASPEHKLLNYVYQVDWKLNLYEKRYSRMTSSWKESAATPKDYSLAAESSRDGCVDLYQNMRNLANEAILAGGFDVNNLRMNPGAIQYTPEIRPVTQTTNVNSSESSYSMAQSRTPNGSFPSLWREYRDDRPVPIDNNEVIGQSCGVMPDPDGFGIPDKINPIIKYGYRSNVLRPIKLIAEIDREITIVVNGITVGVGRGDQFIYLPPDATLQVVTRNTAIRVNLAITVNTPNRTSEVRSSCLHHNAIYTNTSSKPQMIVVYLVNEATPAKIPLLINKLFYPAKNVAFDDNGYRYGNSANIAVTWH